MNSKRSAIVLFFSLSLSLASLAKEAPTTTSAPQMQMMHLQREQQQKTYDAIISKHQKLEALETRLERVNQKLGQSSLQNSMSRVGTLKEKAHLENQIDALKKDLRK